MFCENVLNFFRLARSLLLVYYFADASDMSQWKKGSIFISRHLRRCDSLQHPIVQNVHQRQYFIGLYRRRIMLFFHRFDWRLSEGGRQINEGLQNVILRQSRWFPNAIFNDHYEVITLRSCISFASRSISFVACTLTFTMVRSFWLDRMIDAPWKMMFVSSMRLRSSGDSFKFIASKLLSITTIFCKKSGCSLLNFSYNWK